MADRGRDAYRSQVATSLARGRETMTPPGRLLLRASISRVSDAVRDWMRAAKKKPGVNVSTLLPIKEAGADMATFLTARVVLDGISQTRSFTSVANQVGRVLEDQITNKAFRKTAPALWKSLLGSTKHSGYAHQRAALHLAMMNATDFERGPSWSLEQRVKVGITLLTLFHEHAGLFDIVLLAMPGRRRKQRYIVPLQETLEWAERSHEEHEDLYPVLMPCVQVPLDWCGLERGGYFTDLITRRPLIKAQRRSHLRGRTIEDAGRAVPAINLIQRTPWSINPDVLQLATHVWGDGGHSDALPKQDDVPLPPRPDDIATNEEARREWRREARGIHAINVATRGRRINVARTMMVAEKYRDRPCFFPHHLDYRGRFYPMPGFLSPQSTDLARGLLRFREAMPVDANGLWWLEVHGANLFGMDKVSYDERVAWVHEHRDEVRACADEPLDVRLWESAEDPWQALAWCIDYDRALDTGLSGVSCCVDGTNNGLQLYALLMADTASALATNVVSDDTSTAATPADIYALVASRVQARLTEEQAARLPGGVLPRKAVKRQVMTFAYNATDWSMVGYTRDWLTEEGVAWDMPFVRELGVLIQEETARAASAATDCMAWLRLVAQEHIEAGEPIRWTAPSGFRVTQEYRKRRAKRIRTAVGDQVEWAIARVDTHSTNEVKQLNAFAPNFIHSLDAAIMAEVVLRCHDLGVCHFHVVHDSFGTHAANMGAMASTLREVLRDTFSVDILGQLKDECTANIRRAIPDPPVTGDLDISRVLTSPYVFS